MELIYPCCAGIDARKDVANVCVRLVERSVPRYIERSFGVMPGELDAMETWLKQFKIDILAIERNEPFWKSVWNVLEGGHVLKLVNARRFKNVPGRRSDASDCRWTADLLAHGLLNEYVIPGPVQRTLRELTDFQAKLMHERDGVLRCIHRVLEDANMKLANVAYDILGVSGRSILRSIASGQENPCALAELARHRLRVKMPQLRSALAGRVNEHHRFMLGELLDHLDHLEAKLDGLERQMEREKSSRRIELASRAISGKGGSELKPTDLHIL